MMNASFSFVNTIRASQSSLLYLVKGSHKAEPLWHYVIVDKLKLPLFERQLSSNHMDVANYGEVLESGWGIEPPSEVVNRMQTEYS